MHGINTLLLVFFPYSTGGQCCNSKVQQFTDVRNGLKSRCLPRGRLLITTKHLTHLNVLHDWHSQLHEKSQRNLVPHIYLHSLDQVTPHQSQAKQKK